MSSTMKEVISKNEEEYGRSIFGRDSSADKALLEDLDSHTRRKELEVRIAIVKSVVPAASSFEFRIETKDSLKFYSKLELIDELEAELKAIKKGEQ